jgi:transcriptional regulator with XRE-family HTH domain
MKNKPEQMVDLTLGAKETLRVESRFDEIGRLNSIKEKRLRDLYFIWCNPINVEGKKQSLRLDEIKELREAVIIKNTSDDDSTGPVAADVDICDSQEELAKRMMIHFQNPDKTSKLRIEITKKTISDWHLGKRLSGNIAPFPKIEGARKRYSLRAVIDWFNAYLWHDYRADANQTNGEKLSAFVPLGELRDIAARAELEKTIFDIEIAKGRHLATAKSAAILAGTMRQYHDFLKARLERTSADVFENFWQGIGLTPEQISASKDFLTKELRSVVDDLENEAEIRASETTRRIKMQAKDDAS